MERGRDSQTGKIGIVFYVSLAVSILFLLWGVLFTENIAGVTTAVLEFVLNSFGWLYLTATTLFLGFVVFLAVSRYGSIRLGKDDDRPEFGYFSWFAMLFAAGMGIGLVFWGVAEPISHLTTPPYGMAEAGTSEAGELGLQYSFFHWGLHPWATYSVIAMAIAYANFRKDRGGLISSVFYPLLGDRVDGPIGKAIDILALVATLFGVSVSLGLGALQVNGGLNFLFEVPNSAAIQLIIIAVITVLFLISSATGVGRGIKYLSNLNMVLAALLLVFVFVLGPTIVLLDVFVQTTGSYVGNLIPISFTTDALEQSAWAGDWTLFYWATWIAWCPFVGAFIARISRGRTIREFVIGVLLVPSTLSFLWFSTFGGTALQLNEATGGQIATAVDNSVTAAFFVTLSQLPLSAITSVIVILLVSVFFITSADSASFVLASMSSEGAVYPRIVLRLIWGGVISAFAAVVLLSGGLDALQRVAIIAAVPFAVIMIVMCWAMLKAFSAELQEEQEQKAKQEQVVTVRQFADDLRGNPAERGPEAPTTAPGKE
ncbi:glycine betaine transporter OpuD [soil metagenome]